MKVGYTEFSFDYAFTENLIRSAPSAPVGAPVFPNLIHEARAGFDIRINFPGVPLFFQFKLPELMRRGTAFEIAGGNCPGLNVPFYRIALMRSDISRQHALLIRLERRYPGCVFYAAPALQSVGHFDTAYNAAEVARRSVFFSPRDIGPLPDSKPHSIAYRHDLNVGYFCSNPRSVKAMTYDGLAEAARSRFDEDRFRRLASSARELREAVVEMASPQIREAEGAIVERVSARRARAALQPSTRERATIDLLVAREIARIDFGVDLLVAQPGR
ncbi:MULTISPECIES: hypothetical protein [unclassified Mesorhizobium]|uniref:hypothetical protein n=1 Tax=unclassified Mesorhizobium TaxID=325217 RepID=UPI000FD4623C|nr:MULTISPECIES: hypothetical protein [unclassified Mesorhizobium]RUV80610.1 hypothetical protein EOA88_21645 [Mesorhizobium sp. M5C.F.Ca.IN.020.14.1.1]RUV29242.1 hypothetical protein EOA86_16405 [Mesorhizobium sp. M5C.F.Ca.IN.020.32.2.1]RWG41791.1 MAG: hypothetical protein EOQ62_27255 [Mesorhizobium sp.]RWH55748.1 MAG: hypothetical protein EOQ82_15360 [Mesorhizobium sp.]RWI67786.1 MAG: hypothetical protein EOR18_22855 [Mesorhizobium sp.]